ncbi:MAG: response regulator transcription factor [Steroidobacteraceae bacterium]
MNSLSVILVDDHQLVRAGLRQTIGAQPDIRIVAECSSGREALNALRSNPCNVLLLDLSLPDMSGLDVLKHVRTHHEGVAVLILSGYPEAQFGLNVLRGGASGFVSKSAGEADLLRAIRQVARGNRYVGPELADLLVNGLNGTGNEPLHSVLSEREFQIFCKLAEGVSVTEIAQKLFLSVKTVSTYRTRILEKMGMKTNADITTYAIKNSLLP